MKAILTQFGIKPETNISDYFETKVYDELPVVFSGDRSGWRNNDFWQIKKLNEMNEPAIAVDGDMWVVSEDVKKIEQLVKKFGICLPANSRWLVRNDTIIGADSDKELDETSGTGYAYNTAITAYDPNNNRAKTLVEKFLEIMLDNPQRAPLVWWRAVWETGIYPYLLPQQWCVCEKDIGIGDEIILHIGHEAVRKYYNINGTPR